MFHLNSEGPDIYICLFNVAADHFYVPYLHIRVQWKLPPRSFFANRYSSLTHDTVATTQKLWHSLLSGPYTSTSISTFCQNLTNHFSRVHKKNLSLTKISTTGADINGHVWSELPIEKNEIAEGVKCESAFNKKPECIYNQYQSIIWIKFLFEVFQSFLKILKKVFLSPSNKHFSLFTLLRSSF